MWGIVLPHVSRSQGVRAHDRVRPNDGEDFGPPAPRSAQQTQKTRSTGRMSGCRRPAKVASCWRRARFSRTRHVWSAWPRGASAGEPRGVESSSRGGPRPWGEWSIVPVRLDLWRETGTATLSTEVVHAQSRAWSRERRAVSSAQATPSCRPVRQRVHGSYLWTHMLITAIQGLEFMGYTVTLGRGAPEDSAPSLSDQARWVAEGRRKP